MAYYAYEAKTRFGETVSGKVEANDMKMVLNHIKEKGNFPIQIKVVQSGDEELKKFSRKKITYAELAVFCKQFHTMLDAGVNILRIMEMLKGQVENPKFAFVLNKVYESIKKGVSLSESFKYYKKVFPLMLYSMVEISEISGQLSSVMDRLSTYFEKEQKFQQKIKSAMTYPAFISGISVLLVIFMMIFVVPNFIEMFKSSGKPLPLPTQIIVNISNLFKNPFFLGSLPILWILFSYISGKLKQVSKVKETMEHLIYKSPAGKNLKKVQASRFARSLSLLLKSGVPLTTSLEMMERLFEGGMMERSIANVNDKIKKGSALADAIAEEDMFPSMVVHMIRVGEESGKLDQLVEKVADYYEQESEVVVSKFISMIEPLMISIVAVIVGGIVLAMVMPMFDAYKGIGK